MMQMKEQRPDHLQENTGIASLPMEGRATSNWAVIDAGGEAVDRAHGTHVRILAVGADRWSCPPWLKHSCNFCRYLNRARADRRSQGRLRSGGPLGNSWRCQACGNSSACSNFEHDALVAIESHRCLTGISMNVTERIESTDVHQQAAAESRQLSVRLHIVT